MGGDGARHESSQPPADNAVQPSHAFWRRIPKGWLLLALAALAWLAAYLIFQGVLLLIG
jgi:hypothetical protein